jgi:hypothetical protein
MITSGPSPLTKLIVDTRREGIQGISIFSDPACGEYGAYDHALGDLSPAEVVKIAKVLATKYIRHENQRIILTQKRTQQWEDWNLVPINQLLAQYPKSVVSILDESLINLSQMIKFPSDEISINEITRWGIFAHDRDSEAYIIRQLEELRYIKHAGSTPGGTYMIPRFTIEAKGWERLQDLQKGSSVSDQAFVAMWFDPQMDAFYDNAIQPAIETCGFRPSIIRLKVVADFSGNRGGVYYEAGFAHGLGLPVIWTVRSDFLSEVHFDTRQYNHIVYTTAEELNERLISRIRSTVI